MLFRFSELNLLSDNTYDYDNPKFLGTIERRDYVEYCELLHFMKNMDKSREWGNINLVKEILTVDGDMKTEIDDEPYSIVDIVCRVPLDNTNLDCIEVYVSPSFP